LLHSGIKPTVFFYNPNIHPKKEYEIRKEEDKKFCEKLNLDHIDVDYDPINWFERVKGLEWEPERGARCTQCFDMRFERTALYAYENNFEVFSSSLGISRWKNMKQIN
jgi:predicted adenine nucleotide alpha hydrolase (AANH) superfamily ATPase